MQANGRSRNDYDDDAVRGLSLVWGISQIPGNVYWLRDRLTLTMTGSKAEGDLEVE